MRNVGWSPGEIERGAVQACELRLFDLNAAASAARHVVDAAVQHKRRIDPWIVGDRQRLQSAAAVSANGDSRDVDAPMERASIPCRLAFGPFDGLDHLARLGRVGRAVRRGRGAATGHPERDDDVALRRDLPEIGSMGETVAAATAVTPDVERQRRRRQLRGTVHRMTGQLGTGFSNGRIGSAPGRRADLLREYGCESDAGEAHRER